MSAHWKRVPTQTPSPVEFAPSAIARVRRQTQDIANEVEMAGEKLNTDTNKIKNYFNKVVDGIGEIIDKMMKLAKSTVTNNSPS